MCETEREPEKYIGRERHITVFEEQVLRLVHHEFAAKTQADAAIRLGVSEAMISRTVQDIVKKAETCSPIRIMLPILTKLQFEVYNCITKDGMSLEATAGQLGTSLGSVRSTLHKIRKKGMIVATPMKHEVYMEHMDDNVKMKF